MPELKNFITVYEIHDYHYDDETSEVIFTSLETGLKWYKSFLKKMYPSLDKNQRKDIINELAETDSYHSRDTYPRICVFVEEKTLYY